MMKKNYLFACLLLTSYAYSQVGINTDVPKTTLDVSARRNAAGAIIDNTQTVGMQAPRLTRAELTALTATYGANQNSALIYVTDVTGGNTAGQRINVTALGYYYFDSVANVWQKLTSGIAANPISASNGLNKAGDVIKLGGNLSENTLINQAANSLTFNNTTIGGTKLISDGTAAAPKAAIQIQDGGQGVDKVLTSDATGNASWKTPIPIPTEPWNVSLTSSTTPITQATSNTDNIYQMGKIGIGLTRTPAASLHIEKQNPSDTEANAIFALNHISKYPRISFNRGRFDASTNARSAPILNDVLGAIEFQGFSSAAGVGFQPTSSILSIIDTSEVGSSGFGSNLEFKTSKTGVTTTKLSINSAATTGASAIVLNQYKDATDNTNSYLGLTSAGEIVKKASLSSPWNVANSTTQATSNTQNIYQTGNVGIGSSTPSQKLDVLGTTKTTNLTNGSAAIRSSDFGLYNQENAYTRIVTSNRENGAVVIYNDGASTNNYAGSVATMTIRNSKVGIGTVSTSDPTSKLQVVSAEASTAFQMQDGSEGTGKFLASNSVGQATWVNSPLVPIVSSTSDGSQTSFVDVAEDQYINKKITLTKGRWMIYVGQLFIANNASNDNNYWVRLTLSSNSSSNGNTGFNFLSTRLVSGWLSAIGSNTEKYTFLSGVIPVEVTDASRIIYLRTREFTKTSSAANVALQTRGNFGENYLFAIPAY